MTRAGVRAVPSLRYKESTPPYADLLDNPDGISTPGPGGGLTQDGRAATLAEQARIPLLNPIEMANRSAGRRRREDAAARRYAELFRAGVRRARVRRRRHAPSTTPTQALQAFQLEDRSFHPYSSRYDLYAGNKIGGTMSPAEERGFAVYNDPDKGNCFACHYNGAGPERQRRAVHRFHLRGDRRAAQQGHPGQRDARYADLGLCARPDHAGKANAQYCGEFKTPTLRNVATRKRVLPQRPDEVAGRGDPVLQHARHRARSAGIRRSSGVVQKYDDLPRRYRGQHRHAEAAGRPPGRQHAADDRRRRWPISRPFSRC